MTIDEVISTLELDKETADILRAKAKAEKAASLKSANELQQLEARRAELEAELIADGKKGARNYKQWYEENFPKIQTLQADYAKYVERYGKLDGQPTTTTTTSTPTTGLTKEDVAKLIQDTYTPQWSSLLKGSGKIIERHIRAGRKNELDWDKLGEIAATKNGDLEAAYAAWDAPEAEKAAKEAEEKRINAEVEKRIKAQQTNTFFPSTEQVSTGVSPLSRDRGTDAPKYDRSKVIESAVTGLYEPATVH